MALNKLLSLVTLSKLLTYPKPQRVHLVNKRTGRVSQSGFAQHLAIVNLVVIVIIMSTKTHISFFVTLRERHICCKTHLEFPRILFESHLWFYISLALHFSFVEAYIYPFVHMISFAHIRGSYPKQLVLFSKWLAFAEVEGFKG